MQLLKRKLFLRTQIMDPPTDDSVEKYMQDYENFLIAKRALLAVLTPTMIVTLLDAINLHTTSRFPLKRKLGDHLTIAIHTEHDDEGSNIREG